MFISELRQTDTNRVLIVDFDADIVKHLVDYIHTGHVDAELGVDDNVKLIQIADKYDVQGLKKLAIARIIPQLDLSNIAAIANFAVSLQDADALTQACSEFMMQNRSTMRENKIFKSLSREAANLLLDAVL